MFRWAESAFNESRRFANALRGALTGGQWERAVFRISLLLLALIAVALIYAWTGLFSLSASSGHSALTYWFLDFGKRNVVETMSSGIKAPSLDDPALVLKGAGHYATGCAPCHGAPGKPPGIVLKGMSPEPPYLPRNLERWEDEELFWIVKHGIKYTGMPAWPSLQRDDEVWAMVAFLRTLPELDADAYERLVHGTATKPHNSDVLQGTDKEFASVVRNCIRCHGIDGTGRGVGAFPKLARQNEDYLFESLRAFASGNRASGIMQPVAGDLDPETMRALAEYFAAMPAKNHSPQREREREPDPAFQQGRAIATRGVPERGVAACRHCHALNGRSENAMFPELRGQYADYLLLQLELFRSGERAGTGYARIMNIVADNMTDDEMRAVAVYYSALQPQNEASRRYRNHRVANDGL